MTTIQHMPTAGEREQELAENAYRLVRAVESGSGLVRARPEVLAALAGIARGLAELVELVDAPEPAHTMPSSPPSGGSAKLEYLEMLQADARREARDERED